MQRPSRSRGRPSTVPDDRILETARAPLSAASDQLGLTEGAIRKRRARLIRAGLLTPQRSPGPVQQEIREFVLSQPDALTQIAVARLVAERFGRKIDHKTVYNIRETRYW